MKAQHEPRQCTCELCWPNISEAPAPVNEQEETPEAAAPEDAEATVAMAV